MIYKLSGICSPRARTHLYPLILRHGVLYGGMQCCIGCKPPFYLGIYNSSLPYSLGNIPHTNHHSYRSWKVRNRKRISGVLPPNKSPYGGTTTRPRSNHHATHASRRCMRTHPQCVWNTVCCVDWRPFHLRVIFSSIERSLIGEGYRAGENGGCEDGGRGGGRRWKRHIFSCYMTVILQADWRKLSVHDPM